MLWLIVHDCCHNIASWNGLASVTHSESRARCMLILCKGVTRIYEMRKPKYDAKKVINDLENTLLCSAMCGGHKNMLLYRIQRLAALHRVDHIFSRLHYAVYKLTCDIKLQ